MLAVGLLSGGLDSAIAAYLISEQGYKIKAVNVDTGFISEDLSKLDKLSKRFNIEIIKADVFDIYKKILINPRYGFGKNMNPCLDCRIIMYNAAKEIMIKENADFIFTGEVLGQRPFSQTYRALRLLDEKTELIGKVLRPLSAFYFPPTLVELSGKVKRSNLLAIKGRNRRIQLRLASIWNLTEFNSPGGGCLLTDPGFSKRLKDWFKNEGKNLSLTKNYAQLLKIGRHIRFNPHCRLIVGRNENENKQIEELQEMGYLIKVLNIPGPTALLIGNCNLYIGPASKIVARYSDAKDGEQVKISIESHSNSFILDMKVDKKIKYDMIM